MRLEKWNPFRDLDDIFHNYQRSFLTPSMSRESMVGSEWVPAVDIVEDDKEYQLKVEIPEIPRDAVKLQINHGAVHERITVFAHINEEIVVKILQIDGKRRVCKHHSAEFCGNLVRCKRNTLVRPFYRNSEFRRFEQSFFLRFERKSFYAISYVAKIFVRFCFDFVRNGKRVNSEDFFQSVDKFRFVVNVEIFNEISALRACKVKFQSRKSLLDVFYEQTFKIIAIFAFEEYFPVSDDDNFFHVYVRVA
jgi:HSP20 family protein